MSIGVCGLAGPSTAGQNGVMGHGSGQRAGARRGERKPRSIPRRVPAYVGGGVLGLAAWAVLVWVAIGFGRDARAGDGSSWIFLTLVVLGAMTCLFGSLMLLTAALRTLGILAPPRPHRH